MTPKDKIYQQDRQQAYNRHDEIRRATDPNKLASMPLVQVQEYYNELYSLRDWLHDTTWALSACNERLELLRREIELKTVSERSHRQHKQVICVSGWTLFWAIVGGLGTIGLLLLELPVSRQPIGSPTPATSMSSPPPAPTQSPPPPTATSPPEEPDQTRL